MKEIVFATNNAHKLQELREIVGDKFKILSLNDIDCHDDIPETCPTIEGNAEQKARYIKDHYGYDCFSDDTCLEIDALGGEPGVYSARYAGGDGHDSEANMRKVLQKMDGVPMPERTARFRTAVALLLDGSLHIFDGRVEGIILTEKHGDCGFGYDPIFQPLEGDGRTFAQMAAEEKNAISHRGRAVKKLVQFLCSKQ
ncbi:MAG: non-canonical purine NTP diphosphatase [Bacteroidales bacterium]|nr:non-canonical purine NTP diphosphatase [Bacteroidales bacterium]